LSLHSSPFGYSQARHNITIPTESKSYEDNRYSFLAFCSRLVTVVDTAVDFLSVYLDVLGRIDTNADLVTLDT
jgi:hypothetical protein